MAQLETINTPQDYVNYTFNVEARGIAEVSGELMGLSNTVNSLLGLIAFKTSEFLTHTETMAIGAGVAISAMFTSATQDAIRFQQQVANVKAIGGESVDAQQIGNAAMEYSNKFGMATASMTEGLEALARAGITTTSVMKGVLEEGVKLSKLEGMDLEDSINDLISTTNLLSTEDVDMNAPEYAEMLKTMNQQIVSTSESAPINAQNIIQSLQHVGGYASASGMDQEDLFAVIAQLGARGTKGEMAGTALRAFIAAGQKDTAQRALARIGLNVTDLWDKNGETMLSISEMKDVIDSALEERGYSKQEKLEFYSDFAGYKQANQIMKIDTSEVAKYKESIANAWDLGTKLNTILGTVKGNLDRIWQIATNFMTKVGSKLLTIMGAILTPIRIALELFTKIPFADTAVSVGMLFIGFRTGLMLFNKLVPALGGFMSGLKNVKKESFSFNQIWKDTKKEITLTKEIFDNITDQQSLTKIHLRERGLSANDKFDVETQIAAQMYMGSEEYENTGLEWKELPNAVQNALVAQYKTSDAFKDNYELYIKKTNEFVNNATKNPIRIEKFKKTDKLTSINNYVKYIFNLFKDKFEKDDRTKQGKGGNAGIGSSGSGSGSSSGYGSGSTSGSSSSNGGSRGSATIKSSDERIKEYKKIGQRIQSQASDYGDYLWASSIPELRNPVESFDIQSLIDTRDKIIEDINKKMNNYSTFSPNDLNNMGIERLKKSLTRDAMTNFGIAFSTYSNTSDIRHILSTGQYRKGSSKISSAQINAIAEELGMDITAPERLDEEARENLMLTLSHYYRTKYSNDQSILNSISNRTQKIWHNEQINKKDVSLFPTNTLMKHSDTANQIQSLLGVQSIKGIQDYFKNNKNDADYNDNLNKTVKIMSENSDLVDDLVNAEIKYMYENLVRVQNSINSIKKQSHANNTPQGDTIWGHKSHEDEEGMVYDAAVYLMKAQNKRAIKPQDFYDLIKSVNGEDAAKNIEYFLETHVWHDDFTKKNGNFKLGTLRDVMADHDGWVKRFHKLSKYSEFEQFVSPRQVFDLMQKHPEISNELTESLGAYIDVRLGRNSTQEYFENLGLMDDAFVSIPYEYTWLLGADTANKLESELSSRKYKYGPKPVATFNKALKIWDKRGPEAILNSSFPYLYDDDLRPTVDNSFERMMLGLAYSTLNDKLENSRSLGERTPWGGIHLNRNMTSTHGVEQTLNTLIHEFTHMALQQLYRHELPNTDPLFLPTFSDPGATKYNYKSTYKWLADEFETNWVASQVFKSTGIEQLPHVQDRVKGFYHFTDKNGYTDNLQWELYDEWIKVISENIDKFIDIGEAFDKKYSSLNPEEVSQKWDVLRNQINNAQSVANDEASRKRQEEIANLRKQIANQEALWAKQGEQYAQERVKQQRKLREKQQKVYQEERKKIEEQQKEQAEQYEKSRKDEKKRVQKKWNIHKKENEPSLLEKTKSLIKTALNGDTYYFAGEEKLYNKQTPFQKQLQEKGLWAADKAASYVNSGFNKLSEFNDKHQDEKQKEQTSKRFSQTKESINSALKSMKHFNEGLERAATIFPPLTVAVNALNIAIAIGEGITKALTVAETLLNPAKTYETLINLPLITSEQALILSRTLETATIYATDAAIAALEVLLSGPVLIAIGAVVAAIMAVKFWENKHAESLKESQKALQESTAKNNVALSQYKDMKKAREAETDAIKKQKKARQEAIALYRLEAARIEKQKAVEENAKLKNDSVWGEYGFRANFQKMGWAESIFASGVPFLGTIMKSLSGEFESQYENYDGTTANIRQIKEDTLGNLFTTKEQRYAASVYDKNSMFFATVEAYSEPLQALYDKESQLIEQYGSIDLARGTKEFEDAVQEFADATGLNGETAGKMLDWLETENRVNQATQAMQAQVNIITARADAKALSADIEDTSFLDDNHTLEQAMIMAQAQNIYQEAYDYMWWEKFQADLFGILWTILDHMVVWDWTDHATKYWKKSEAYEEGMKELAELGVRGVSDIGNEMAENADRRNYGTGVSYYNDSPFGAALESAEIMETEYSQQMALERRYTMDETQKFQKELNEGMIQTGQSGVEGFKTGLDQHSPGAISRSMGDEMIYTQDAIQENYDMLMLESHKIGENSVISFKDGLGQDPEGNISKSVNDEMLYTQEAFENNREPIKDLSYDIGYESGEQYGQGFMDGLKSLYRQISTPEALTQSLEDRILVRQGYGVPEGANPNDPEVQSQQSERRAETEFKLFARSGIGSGLVNAGKREGKSAWKVMSKEGVKWQNASVAGRIINSAEIASSDGLKAGAKALFSPKNASNVPTGKVAGAVDDALKGVGKYGAKGLEKLGIDNVGGKALSWIARNFGDDAAKGAAKLGGKAAKAIPFLGTGITAAFSIAEHNPFEKHYNEDGSEKRAFQSTGEVAGAIAGSLVADVIGLKAGPVAGMIAGFVLEPLGEAIGGTIGWLTDEVVNTKFTDAWAGFNDALGGIPNQIVGFIDQSPIGQAGHFIFDQLDNLTGGWLGETWDKVQNSSIIELPGVIGEQLWNGATGLWTSLTGGEDNNKPVGGALGFTPIGMGINVAAGIGEWLFGGNEKNDPYKSIEKATGQKMPKVGSQSKNTIIIKNININTEDDPEKIKSAFMNLIIELQEQVNPRQVSRTVGEPPQAQSSNTNENNEGEDANQNQAEGSDSDSTNPTI